MQDIQVLVDDQEVDLFTEKTPLELRGELESLFKTLEQQVARHNDNTHLTSTPKLIEKVSNLLDEYKAASILYYQSYGVIFGWCVKWLSLFIPSMRRDEKLNLLIQSSAKRRGHQKVIKGYQSRLERLQSRWNGTSLVALRDKIRVDKVEQVLSDLSQKRIDVAADIYIVKNIWSLGSFNGDNGRKEFVQLFRKYFGVPPSRDNSSITKEMYWKLRDHLIDLSDQLYEEKIVRVEQYIVTCAQETGYVGNLDEFRYELRIKQRPQAG